MRKWLVQECALSMGTHSLTLRHASRPASGPARASDIKHTLNWLTKWINYDSIIEMKEKKINKKKNNTINVSMLDFQWSSTDVIAAAAAADRPTNSVGVFFPLQSSSIGGSNGFPPFDGIAHCLFFVFHSSSLSKCIWHRLWNQAST